MKKLIDEFKKFIMRGNVIDLAVGVVMGNAFSKIVSSLVNDIMMPIIGVIIGGHDFSNLSITVGSAKIMYGSFIQNIIDFLIMAACVFVLVKVVNKIDKLTHLKKEEPEKEEKPKKSDEVILLEEIKNELVLLNNPEKKVNNKNNKKKQK